MYKVSLLISACVLGLLAQSSGFALEKIPVSQNGSALIKVSGRAANKIFVSGDKIKSVVGSSNDYRYQNDNSSGSLYLRPTTQKPFSLFVNTKGGRSFSLLIVPESLPSQTVEVLPLGPGIEVHSDLKASDYVNKLTTLLIGMVTGNIPKGFSANRVIDSDSKQLGDIASYQLIERFDGEYFSGYKYRITNLTDKTITLSANQFRFKGTRAVALTKEEILPHLSGYLYEVR